jgi:hypothetical protein
MTYVNVTYIKMVMLVLDQSFQFYQFNSVTQMCIIIHIVNISNDYCALQ